MSNIQENVCCFELSSVASLDKSHQVKHRTNEQREAQMKTLNVNQHIMQYKHVICCHNCLYLCRTMFNVNHLLLHSHIYQSNDFCNYILQRKKMALKHFLWHNIPICSSILFQFLIKHIWVKVFKNGPNKICGRQPLNIQQILPCTNNFILPRRVLWPNSSSNIQDLD